MIQGVSPSLSVKQVPEIGAATPENSGLAAHAMHSNVGPPESGSKQNLESPSPLLSTPELSFSFRLETGGKPIQANKVGCEIE